MIFAMSLGWGEVGDAADLLEALYRIDLEEDAWLDGIWQALGPLVPGAPWVMTGTYSWAPGQSGFRPSSLRGGDLQVIARARETGDQADSAFLQATWGASQRVYTLAETFGPRLGELPIGAVLGELGVRDMLALQTLSHGGPHDGVMVAVPSSTTIELPPHRRALWDRIGAHLAAAQRLRRGDGCDHPAECVLEADGKVAHAEGSAREPAMRDALGRAVCAIERARCGDARRDPREVLEAWRAIVERRWTLLEVVERDGRRFMLARVNPASRIDDAALTVREREVASLMAQGVPQKAIGYELAMAPSTVSFHLRNIARKLGATGSVELVRILATRRAAESSTSQHGAG